MLNRAQSSLGHGPTDEDRGTWQPLLSGVTRESALEVACALAERLSVLSEAHANGTNPAQNETAAAGSESLADGAAGLAVLFAYLSRVRSDQRDETRAATLLERAIAAAAEAPLEATLYGGLAGVGWATTHVRDRFLPADGEDVNDEIDEALSEHVAESPWRDDYDLINGLVGFGVYALERLPRPAAVTCLQCVIERLAEAAQRRPDGITWWTDPAWLPDETRQKFPRGYYNTGLAHGVPGVVALLGCACAAGVATDLAHTLLDGAVRWLLAQQLPGGFPAWVAPDGPPQPTRLAWCYGDPGVSASLLWAARCVHEPEWEHHALSMARRAALRSPDKSGVVDAGLCHGAAGLGHIYNRLYQATGEEQFAETARFWFERTLAMRQPERGIAGYAAWMPSLAGNQEGWVDDPGVLTGAAGIALALLAATTTIEPEWDRMLLVSVPPRRATA